MNKESGEELQWWIPNLKVCNGRLIIQHQSFVIIKTDASYVLTKIGGYGEQETLGSSQEYMGLYNEEWDHNYSRIPANLPKCGGKLALKEPQGQFRVETSSPNISSNLPNKRDSRDRLVCISTVKSASKIFRLETGPIQSGPTQHPWGSKYLYAFPPFSMINKVLNKVKQVMLGNMVLVEPTWQSRTWYPILLSMSIEKPKLLPQYQHLLMNPQKQLHLLLINKTVISAVWTVSGKSYLQEAFQRQLTNLFQVCDDQVQNQITTRLGHSGLAGVMKKKLIHFDVI